MIEIDVSNRDSIPLDDTQFEDVLHQMTSEVDPSTLSKEMGLNLTHIFDLKGTNNFTDGFQITIQMFLNDNNEVSSLITEMIVFEDDDEWLEAYSKIKNKNKPKH